MDFGLGWGTDEFIPTDISDYGMHDIHMSEKKIQQHVKYPVHTFPESYIKPISKKMPTMLPEVHDVSKKISVEGFVDPYMGSITEKTLIIILLVILVVMCTVIYQSIKQTQESIKLLLTIIATQNYTK
jgi:hypothetical protein